MEKNEKPIKVVNGELQFCLAPRPRL